MLKLKTVKIKVNKADEKQNLIGHIPEKDPTMYVRYRRG